MFKNQVFIVECGTIYSESGMAKYKPARKESSHVEGAFSTERKAIACIEAYIKGFIDSCKFHPIMTEHCIGEIPKRKVIKQGMVRFYEDDDRCEWITYHVLDVE